MKLLVTFMALLCSPKQSVFQPPNRNPQSRQAPAGLRPGRRCPTPFCGWRGLGFYQRGSMSHCEFQGTCW
jgi:hypothetical protein